MSLEMSIWILMKIDGETCSYGERDEDVSIYRESERERDKDIHIDVITDIDTDIRNVVDMDINVDKN